MSVVPIDFQDGINDFDVGLNESIFLSFVCPMTHMNVYVLSLTHTNLLSYLKRLRLQNS